MSIEVGKLKALREKTGAGVMDCRKALDQAGGDADAAQALIRQWGLDEVEKRTARETNEGCVGLVADSSRAAMAALACETDFVARNELFTSAARTIARRTFELRLAEPDQVIRNEVADLGLRMKENIVLKRIAYIEAGERECIDSYLHGDSSIGAAVRVRFEDPARADDAGLHAAIHDLCLQVAARHPLYISADAVPAEAIEKVKEKFSAEMAADPKLAAKSASILEGVAAGKLRKYFSETCLYGQRFIKDEAIDVGKFIARAGSETGARFEVTGFMRLAVRDGEARDGEAR
jgi:elongation factor Ts